MSGVPLFEPATSSLSPGALRSFLNANYQSAVRTQQDIEDCLRYYPMLKAVIHDFVNQGMRYPAIRLTGTIPISYLGHTYNIPVHIWLPREYPSGYPHAYVVPTHDMMLANSHPHVGRDGRVYMPYLTEWSTRSNLVELCTMMASMFGSKPPLFARPQPVQSQPNRQSWSGPSSGYSSGGGSSNPYAGFRYNSVGASSMPYGGASQPNPGTSVGSGSVPTSQPGPYGTSPYSPYTSGNSSGSGSPATSSTSSRPAYPGALNTSRPGYQPGDGTYTPPASSTASSTSSQSSGSFSNPYGAPQRDAAQGQGAKPKPARPPPPKQDKSALVSKSSEAVQQMLAIMRDSKKESMSSIQRDMKALHDSRQKVSRLLDGLLREREGVERDLAALEEQDNRLVSDLEKLGSSGDQNIDESIVCTSPVHNQLLKLIAEDRAIDDAIYYLGRALQLENIELPQYLKLVRNLSRRQFMKKALILKVQQQLRSR